MRFGILTPIVWDLRSIEKELGISKEEGELLDSWSQERFDRCSYKIITSQVELSLNESLKQRREKDMTVV